MNTSIRRRSFERILLDMNTQCDFLLPKGALPVANRSEILPNIRKIMNWGRTSEIPVISSLESHRPGESTNGLPSYCVDRTNGQKKLPFTLMPHRIVLHGDNTLDLPHEPFRRYRQVIFTKRDRDFLSNPKADRLINTIHARCLVVFGVLAEQCVKLTVLGLLARHHRIIVIQDACGYWYASEAELAFRQMDAKGAVVATTEELLSGRAEARLEASPRALMVDDDEPAPQPACAGAGDDDEPAVAHTPHCAKLGDNGRAAPARRSRPTPEASDPAEMPYQDDRLPDLRRINARHDLA